MSDERIDDWASHLPLLTAACTATTGPILECGAGLYSTPVLHALCAPTGRLLVTAESDATWLNRFASYVTPWHRLERVVWDGFGEPGIFDVVLIDHGQAPRMPVARIAMLSGTPECIYVFHDSECHYCGYEWSVFDWTATDVSSPTYTTLAGFGPRPSWVTDWPGILLTPPVCYRG